MDSFGRALGVAGLIRVNSGAPWRSSRSFRFVGFIQVRPGARRVHLGLLGSFGRALRVCRFHSVKPWVSLGSFGILGFIHVRPGGSRVHSGSLRSFVRALGVVVFIPVRWVHSCAAGRR